MTAEPKFYTITCGYLKVVPSELLPKLSGGEIAKIGSVRNVSFSSESFSFGDLQGLHS